MDALSFADYLKALYTFSHLKIGIASSKELIINVQKNEVLTTGQLLHTFDTVSNASRDNMPHIPVWEEKAYEKNL